MDLYYCPFCGEDKLNGACIHVKKIKFDSSGEVIAVVFRNLTEIGMISPDDVARHKDMERQWQKKLDGEPDIDLGMEIDR